MPVHEEDLIFHFTVGNQAKAVDPFRVERMIAQSLGEESLAAVLQQSRAIVTQISGPAIEKLLVASQTAFGITPVQPDGTGSTEKAQMRVLIEFLRWRNEVKKNIASPVISSPPTAPAFSPFQPKNASDCGCSENAPVSNAVPR